MTHLAEITDVTDVDFGKLEKALEEDPGEKGLQYRATKKQILQIKAEMEPLFEKAREELGYAKKKKGARKRKMERHLREKS